MVNVKILGFRKIIFSQKKSNIINDIVTLVNIEPIFEYIYGGNQKHPKLSARIYSFTHAFYYMAYNEISWVKRMLNLMFPFGFDFKNGLFFILFFTNHWITKKYFKQH